MQELRFAAGKGFQGLKEKCASIKLPALQKAEEEEFLWDELQPDGTSQKLLPPDKGSRYSALKTTADGNCFFRTASILAFGNEHKHDEMRVRIVIELACNSDFYLKDKDIEKMLIAEAQELEADEAPEVDQHRHCVLRHLEVYLKLKCDILLVIKFGHVIGIFRLWQLSLIVKC